MTWKLYEADCFDVFPEIEKDSIDLIILDPPYNIGKDKWDKFQSHEDYLKFIKKTLIECERVLKDNGSLYLWHNQFPVLCDFQWLIKKGTGLILKQLITWSKIDKEFNNSGFVNQRLAIDGMRNYYNGFTEYCLFYTFQDETGLETITDKYIKPKNPFARYLREEFKRANVTRKEIAKLFPSKTGGLTGCVSNWLNGDNIITKEQYLTIREYLNNEYLREEYEYLREEYEDLREEYEDLREEYEDLREEYEDLRYCFNVTNATENLRSNSNVWVYPPEPQIGHITPKPIKLCENIILHSSNEFDSVLIPFAGSGSEMKASKNLNRNVIGIEKEHDYCNIIRERMQTVETLQVEQRKQQTLTDFIPAK